MQARERRPMVSRRRAPKRRVKHASATLRGEVTWILVDFACGYTIRTKSLHLPYLFSRKRPDLRSRWPEEGEGLWCESAPVPPFPITIPGAPGSFGGA